MVFTSHDGPETRRELAEAGAAAHISTAEITDLVEVMVIEGLKSPRAPVAPYRR